MKSSSLWRVALATLVLSVPAANALAPGRANLDVEALVGFGPRVAGTPAVEKAANYLVDQYKKAGYNTEIRTFTYTKFLDLGSSVTVDRLRIEGRALMGSGAGKAEGVLIAIPNFGRASDYAGLDVKGKIVIVKRGEIRFLEKVRAAQTAGAIAVIVTNAVPGPLAGTLGEDVKLPALALDGTDGLPLYDRALKGPITVQLEVNAKREAVTGRNVIAFMPGTDKPKLILGGHFDSVPGSPGANDNASGTAVTLEIARQLAGTPYAKQTWFMAFDGEEDGLQGSRAFVEKMPSDFRAGLRAMLNFDMVGVKEGLAVGGSPKIVEVVQSIDPKIDSFNDFSGSDHAPFYAAGVPVAFYWRGYDPNYHLPGDLKVDPALLDETARVGLETVKRILDAPSSN